MKKMQVKKEGCLLSKAKNGIKQSYNELERIFFLLALLIIIALGMTISLPLFILVQVKALFFPKRNKKKE